ncbi:MAG: hypothetical protein AB9903_00565 [Vulcanimicrobiota bacterium]
MMNMLLRWKRAIFFLSCVLLLQQTAVTFSENEQYLKIDPMLLISLKECRNITSVLGDELFPGFYFKGTAVLLYRPNIQDVLINFPGKPEGFELLTGFNPLGNEAVYIRNGTTHFKIDAQNTATKIEDVDVLVVADMFSQMRSQISHMVSSQSREKVDKWLEQWNFMQSPYDEITMLLHEAFHAFQNKMAPEKHPDETILTDYPVLDPVNNALIEIEGKILKDALLAGAEAERMRKTKEFVAVRALRQGRLDRKLAEYENLGEYDEGTAKYIEYRFLRIGKLVKPIPEMYYRAGFNGYDDPLKERFKNLLDRMTAITSLDKNSSFNRFSAFPVRYRTYDMGACQSLLLDYCHPGWKEKIFAKDITLCGLLEDAMNLSKPLKEEYLGTAKKEYDYSRIYEEKLIFQKDGEKYLAEKRDSILKTSKTLISVSYGMYDRIQRMGYTAFGVTRIDDNEAIYELVPVRIYFAEGHERALTFKKVVPVLINRKTRVVSFAVETPLSQVQEGIVEKLDIGEFTLSHPMSVKKENNKVIVTLR